MWNAHLPLHPYAMRQEAQWWGVEAEKETEKSDF
jgi:hypothetical protein